MQKTRMLTDRDENAFTDTLIDQVERQQLFFYLKNKFYEPEKF